MIIEEITSEMRGPQTGRSFSFTHREYSYMGIMVACRASETSPSLVYSAKIWLIGIWVLQVAFNHQKPVRVWYELLVGQQRTCPADIWLTIRGGLPGEE